MEGLLRILSNSVKRDNVKIPLLDMFRMEVCSIQNIQHSTFLFYVFKVCDFDVSILEYVSPQLNCSQSFEKHYLTTQDR